MGGRTVSPAQRSAVHAVLSLSPLYDGGHDKNIAAPQRNDEQYQTLTRQRQQRQQQQRQQRHVVIDNHCGT